MDAKQIIEAFKAFNVNSVSNLAYVLMSNWAFALIAVAAVAAAVLALKDEVEMTVREEQQVL